jgi:hypothetical protein
MPSSSVRQKRPVFGGKDGRGRRPCQGTTKVLRCKTRTPGDVNDEPEATSTWKMGLVLGHVFCTEIVSVVDSHEPKGEKRT